MSVFEGDQLVVEDYFSPAYEFRDAAQLANSVIEAQGMGLKTIKAVQSAKPRDVVQIQPPPCPSGFGPATCVVIREAVPFQ